VGKWAEVQKILIPSVEWECTVNTESVSEVLIINNNVSQRNERKKESKMNRLARERRKREPKEKMRMLFK
jgi:hypothetical protein